MFVTPFLSFPCALTAFIRNLKRKPLKLSFTFYKGYNVACNPVKLNFLFQRFHSVFIWSFVDGAFVCLQNVIVVERGVLTLNRSLHAHV